MIKDKNKTLKKALAGLFVALSCAGGTAGSNAVIQTPLDKDRAQARRLPPGTVPADGAGIDKATGLPTRIVHKASGISLALIPAGEFQMGSPAGEADRSSKERQHRRVIRSPFYLGETEVTVGQFRRFVQATLYQTDAERGTPEGENCKGAFASVSSGNREWSTEASWQNPFPYLSDYRMRDDHPVVQVSWNDARRFCEHFGLQLPTEAQWEYACRAGSRERFFWGDSEADGKLYGNVNDATYRRRFPSIGSGFPFDDGVALLSVVGRYRPNAWKLYDMVGNVEEWCQDAHQKYPDDGADESAARADGNSGRVLRGGSWLDHPFLCRSAARPGFLQQGRRDFIGFRVALVINL